MMRIACAALAVGLVLGCSSAKKSGSDNSPHPLSGKDQQFCDRWAEAACNAEVTQRCVATSTDACIASQRAFCMRVAPDGVYVVSAAQDCIDAVTTAYEDASLTATEYATVREMGGPCADLLTGGAAPIGEGDPCLVTADCGSSALVCVGATPDGTEGTCEAPVVRNGGQTCGADNQVCAAGVYCDVAVTGYCIERPGAGADCSDAVPCLESLYCDATTLTCLARGSVGDPCTAPEQCASGLCQELCVNTVDLAVSTPICTDLR
jgi:hypothetical protein